MRWLAPLLLIGCALSEDDLDGDGWTVRPDAAGYFDCDDLDPNINPDAEDLLDDGLDQDCDGFAPVVRETGENHSCVLGSNGQVVCDGLESPDPDHFWVMIAAGNNHACALDDLGEINCWGDNEEGQTEVEPGVFRAVSAEADFSIGLLLDINAEPLCWGKCWPTPSRE